MKKTLTVNLGGTVFNIDDDAYRLLDNYLSNLKIHFRKEAGADEIVDDIERRISELFAEKLSAGSQVITIADVEEVIARMGKPEELEPDAGDAASGSGSWDGSNHAGNTGAAVPMPVVQMPEVVMVPVHGAAIPLIALHAAVSTAILMTRCWVVSLVEWLPIWVGM